MSSSAYGTPTVQCEGTERFAAVLVTLLLRGVTLDDDLESLLADWALQPNLGPLHETRVTKGVRTAVRAGLVLQGAQADGTQGPRRRRVATGRPLGSYIARLQFGTVSRAIVDCS